MNLLCRLAIPAALLVSNTACFSFDSQMKSQELDVTTWSAEPIADVNQDGCRDILLSASPQHDAPDPDTQLRSWVLSGKNLDPICCLAAKTTDQGLGTIRIRTSHASDDSRTRDLLGAVTFVGEDQSAWQPTWFRVSISKAAVVGTCGYEGLDTDGPPAGTSWVNVALVHHSASNWWDGGNLTVGEGFELWDHRIVCHGVGITGSISDLRAGEQISAAQVFLRDGPDEHDVAIPLNEALNRAKTAGLDLVQLSDSERPPECAILDYLALKARYERVVGIQNQTRGAQVSAAHPEMQDPQLCGDMNRDGVLDWLGLVEKPLSVCIVSGEDLSVLRTIPMSDHPMATVATGGFEIDDIDGDGVGDWVIGVQVSQSDHAIAPRTCKLGLISLVSGASQHVIRTLDRESFLSGLGEQCPLVQLPPAIAN